jgi:hypothetical protein
MTKLSGGAKMRTPSVHENAEALLAWMRERSHATVADIVASGLMASRTASDVVQYACRCGALARDVRKGASARDRISYRVTGVALPAPRAPSVPTFDCLLSAWGIALDPPHLATTASRRHEISDHDASTGKATPELGLGAVAAAHF